MTNSNFPCSISEIGWVSFLYNFHRIYSFWRQELHVQFCFQTMYIHFWLFLCERFFFGVAGGKIRWKMWEMKESWWLLHYYLWIFMYHFKQQKIFKVILQRKKKFPDEEGQFPVKDKRAASIICTSSIMQSRITIQIVA